MERISKELATYIGPIAEVVVRRAARRCSSTKDLCDTVAHEIEFESDRVKFLRSCKLGQLSYSSANILRALARLTCIRLKEAATVAISSFPSILTGGTFFSPRLMRSAVSETVLSGRITNQ